MRGVKANRNDLVSNYLQGITFRGWVNITLFNLFVVASIGFLMRYKILFSLPWINQRFLLHSHSHFAFSGWISQALILAITMVIFNLKWNDPIPKKYHRLLLFNLFCSYGMLISFVLQGYGTFSIIFSTLTIAVGFLFLAFCKRDISSLDKKTIWWTWLRAALWLNILSCLGTFCLVYVMVSDPVNTYLRLASVYFYLHFQYNGWFFFAIMGLFQHWLYQREIILPKQLLLFRIFLFTCLPAYLLSINWLAFPLSLHFITFAIGFVQLIGWIWFLKIVWSIRKEIVFNQPKLILWLFVMLMIATSIKFSLQSASGIPAIANLAFGLRPVVIAYLHLVLLGIVSLFLFSWYIINHGIAINSINKTGIIVFIIGFLLNELVLLFQGVGAIVTYHIPYTAEYLLVAAIILVLGAGLLVFGSVFPNKHQKTLH